MYESSPSEFSLSGNASASSIAYGDRADAVYDWILTRIVEVEFAPGTFLDKQAIADAVGVSRQPVTVALSRLAREGWVEIENRVGSYVARINLTSLREFCFIWCAFNSLVLRDLIGNPPPGLQEQMEQLCKEYTTLRASSPPQAVLGKADEVLWYFVEQARNDKALSYYGMFRSHVRRFLGILASDQQMQPAVQELLDVVMVGVGQKVEAIARRDLDGALKASDDMEAAFLKLFDLYAAADAGVE